MLSSIISLRYSNDFQCLELAQPQIAQVSSMSHSAENFMHSEVSLLCNILKVIFSSYFYFLLLGTWINCLHLKNALIKTPLFFQVGKFCTQKLEPTKYWTYLSLIYVNRKPNREKQNNSEKLSNCCIYHFFSLCLC